MDPTDETRVANAARVYGRPTVSEQWLASYESSFNGPGASRWKLASPLNVVLDATPLSIPTGGIRRYTAELARALAARYPADAYWLSSDQPFDMPAGPPNLRRAPARPSRRWWALGLPAELRRLEADVFHGTDFAVPYLPIRPAVMTLHDLSPWRAGVAASASRRVRQRTPWLLRMGLATMVLTPSETVRREAMAHFHLRPDRVIAIPLAPSLEPAPAPPRARPYFLCVGASDPRKNLRVVHDAWTQLRDRADLIIAGRADEHLPGAIYPGPVSDAELAALYSGSEAFLYPSTYEGFGLPVIEAMHCGAAVIASEDPAVMETAGGDAIHVDSRDSRAWLEAMRAALDPALRAEWRDRGRKRASAFTWERTAILTREAYDEARRLF